MATFLLFKIMHAILGLKKEQTQKFRVDGKRIPVTVVEVAKNPVIAIRTVDKDGYVAVQLGYGTAKRSTKPMAGHMKGANLEKAPRFLKEVRFANSATLEEMPKVGEFVSLDEVLKPGDVIDVTGTSKGKGFAGGVKRFHFRGGPRTHGQSDRERAPGSIGQTTTPGRVYKGKRMAGKMGFETVTVRNLTVAGILGDTLLIEGLIPGPLGAFITITKRGEDKNYADLIEVAEAKEAAAKQAAETEAQAQAEAEKAAQEAASNAVEEQTTEATSDVVVSEPIAEEAKEVTSEAVEPTAEVKEEEAK